MTSIDLAPHATALPVDSAVLVIGAGIMGSGIAQVAAMGGHRVYLRDTSDSALERGLAQIAQELDRRVQRQRLDAAQRDAILERVTLSPVGTAVRGVGLVIEVIVEQLEAKCAVLAAVESEVGAEAIIATNTSSLSVTAIAGRLARPDRVVGMHFFNPATVLPLVEVVAGASTALAVLQRTVATARAWGKVPVTCRSTPGFIVNRIARPFYGEALRLLQEQATTPATLDAVMRESGGFRMGPCELMDLIGHDVNFAVTRSVYEAFFHEPRFRPSLVQQELVAAGWLGRKSGRGFFDYGEGASRPSVDEAGGRAVRLQDIRVEGSLGPAHALLELLKKKQEEVSFEQVGGAGLLRVDGFAVALSDGRSAAERSLALGEPVVVFDLALDFARCARVALAAAAQASDVHIDKAIALFTLLGKQVSLLDDAPGMVVTRTVAMLVNEAAEALQQGIASADDIDAAMQHGVNYPVGPLAWGRTLGFGHVLTVLRHLGAACGEDRYRPSRWLQRFGTGPSVDGSVA